MSSPADSRLDAAPRGSAPGGEEEPRPPLLVIDDDASDRKIVRRALRAGGIENELDEAASGREGLRLARQRAYGCVLLDYGLPDAVGVEILAQLSEAESASVVVLTGRDSDELAIQMMETGAVDHLRKSEIDASLVRAVRYALARRRYAMERRRLERELERSQRLELVGRLAAGVAHEINTPTQFVSHNVAFCKRGFLDLVRLVETFEDVFSSARDALPMSSLDKLELARRASDLDFLLEEMPSAIADAEIGLKDIAAIVDSMRDLAHPSSRATSAVDVSTLLARASAVTRGEWGHVARLEVECEPDLEPISAVQRDLQQLFMNLIVNAAQAIADSPRDQIGEIRIHARRDGSFVEVCVSDDGGGVPPEIAPILFQPFVTSKAPGKGTGQGLAIAHATATRHGGSLEFRSRHPARGTTFVVRLPFAGAAPPTE